MSYGIGKLDTTFPKWKIFFFILGAWTLRWTVVVVLVLPDSPLLAKFATDKERLIAVDRLRHKCTGTKNTTVKRYQIVEAFKDPAIWILIVWWGLQYS